MSVWQYRRGNLIICQNVLWYWPPRIDRAEGTVSLVARGHSGPLFDACAHRLSGVRRWSAQITAFWRAAGPRRTCANRPPAQPADQYGGAARSARLLWPMPWRISDSTDHRRRAGRLYSPQLAEFGCTRAPAAWHIAGIARVARHMRGWRARFLSPGRCCGYRA